MRSPIHIHYGLNGADLLLISCYHAADMALTNYKMTSFPYKKSHPFPPSIYMLVNVDDNKDLQIAKQNLKKAIMDALEVIINECGAQAVKVIFLADVNLGISDSIAEFLLDDTLPKTFAKEGILVARTLESGTPEVVKKGATVYDSLANTLELKSALKLKIKGAAAQERDIHTDVALEQLIKAKKAKLQSLRFNPDPGDNASNVDEGDKASSVDEGDKASNVDEGDLAHNTSISPEVKNKVDILTEISSMPNEIERLTSQLNKMEVTTDEDKQIGFTH